MMNYGEVNNDDNRIVDVEEFFIIMVKNIKTD